MGTQLQTISNFGFNVLQGNTVAGAVKINQIGSAYCPLFRSKNSHDSGKLIISKFTFFSPLELGGLLSARNRKVFRILVPGGEQPADCVASLKVVRRTDSIPPTRKRENNKP